MKITRENYEPFFLDYLEGNLEEHLVDDFIEFLQQNPDLKNELQLFETVTIPAEELKFPEKNMLYRNKYDQPEIFEQTSIAWLEGDLSISEAGEFMSYIEKNPKRKKELSRYELTRIRPDLSVTFSKKDKLYPQPVIRQIKFWTMRVAAVLLVATALWILWPSDTDENVDQPAISELIPGNEATENHEPIDNKVINLQNADKNLTAQEKPAIKRNEIISAVDTSISDIDLYQRRELSVPDLLPAKKINIEVSYNEPLFAFTTQPVTNEFEPDFDKQEYLTDKLQEKLGIEDFTFAKIMRSGLELASNISNEKVSYDTNSEGEIVALSLNTNLLGFRIPVGRK